MNWALQQKLLQWPFNLRVLIISRWAPRRVPHNPLAGRVQDRSSLGKLTCTKGSCYVVVFSFLPFGRGSCIVLITSLNQQKNTPKCFINLMHFLTSVDLRDMLKLEQIHTFTFWEMLSFSLFAWYVIISQFV